MKFQPNPIALLALASLGVAIAFPTQSDSRGIAVLDDSTSETIQDTSIEVDNTDENVAAVVATNNDYGKYGKYGNYGTYNYDKYGTYNSYKRDTSPETTQESAIETDDAGEGAIDTDNNYGKYANYGKYPPPGYGKYGTYGNYQSKRSSNEDDENNKYGSYEGSAADAKNVIVPPPWSYRKNLAPDGVKRGEEAQHREISVEDAKTIVRRNLVPVGEGSADGPDDADTPGVWSYEHNLAPDGVERHELAPTKE